MSNFLTQHLTSIDQELRKAPFLLNEIKPAFAKGSMRGSHPQTKSEASGITSHFTSNLTGSRNALR